MYIKIKRLTDTAIIPYASTEQSAGMDLFADISSVVQLGPNSSLLVQCGFAMELPEQYFALICSRSGMALFNQVIVLNAPGIIDADYRGEVCVLLKNLSPIPYFVRPQAKIAQMLIQTRVSNVHWGVVDELGSTERGTGGFGSTGNIYENI